MTTTATTHPPCPHRVVRASAGTGKTYQLSTRYLKLLLLDGAPPETILATTFTRKAAGEILSRVVLRLARAATDEREAAELAAAINAPELSRDACLQQLARLCRDLHHVNVTTIDAFFHQAARAFRTELDLPPDPALVDEQHPAVAQLRLEAVEAVLSDAAGQPDPGHAFQTLVGLIRDANLGQAHRSVIDSLHKLFAGNLYQTYRDAPDPELWDRLDIAPGHLSRTELAIAMRPMDLLAAQMPNDTWANAHRAARTAAIDHRWDAFLSITLVKYVAAGRDKFARRLIPEKVRAIYQPLVANARAFLVDRLAKQTRATHELLRRFDAHFTRLRRAHGLVLYSDLPHLLARRLPLDDPDLLDDLYFRLDRRVAHLLIDEFQDTSLRQWDVLRPIAHEVAAHADGSRTFFCVGDVKQAIYGWRGGCAELMNGLPDELHLPQDAVDALNLSYRSSPIVLHAVNAVFKNLADNPCLIDHREAARSWADPFPEHGAHHADLPGYVELVTSAHDDDNGTPAASDSDDDDDDHRPPTSHERFAVERISEMIRSAPSRTVGVLVATNAQVKRYLDLLHATGVRASGEGGVPLAADPAVSVFLSALTLADHPGHSAAAFHVCKSPLAPVLGLGGYHATHTRPVARAIRRQLLDDGYALLISRWTAEIAEHCEPEHLIALDRLVELADHAAAAAPGANPLPTIRPTVFADYVRATPVEEPSPSPVRVMTINKAKGLEFDAVVVPELTQKLIHPNADVVYTDRPHPTAPPTAVYRAVTQAMRALCPQIETAYTQHLRATLHDAFSKLYVAMTRAKHALHMILPPMALKQDGQPRAEGWSSPSFAAILRRALSTLRDAEDPAGNQTLYTHGNHDWASVLTTKPHPAPAAGPPRQPKPRPSRLAPRSAPPTRLRPHVTPSALAAAERRNPADLLAVGPRSALARGTVIHAWFQMIDWIDPAQPLAAIDDDALSAVALRLHPNLDAAQLADLIRSYRQMLAQPNLARTLTRPTLGQGEHLELWKERPFAVIDRSRLVEGVFDRVQVTTRDNQPSGAVLIDFKTDQVAPGQADRCAQRYAPQLEAYRNAAAHLLKLDPTSITAKLLFVAADLVVTL